MIIIIIIYQTSFLQKKNYSIDLIQLLCNEIKEWKVEFEDQKVRNFLWMRIEDL